jgi:hypothetical protein
LIRAALGVCAVLFVLTRAILVPITYDEAISLVNYVESQPLDLLDFSVATNHLANSVLSRLSVALFGSAPWSLRLPNVLASILFVFGSAHLVSRSRSHTAATAAFAILTLNPYLLEYLALSRGYGLAVSSLFTASVLLATWWESPRPRHRLLTVSLCLAAFAVTANFGVLTGFLALCSAAIFRSLSATPTTAAASHVTVRSLLPTGTIVVAWAVGSVLYTGAVLSRTRVLDGVQMTPILVRFAGLFNEELDAIGVYQTDATGRTRPMSRIARGTWSTRNGRNVRSVRIALPVQTDKNVASLEVLAGTDQYARGPGEQGPWRTDDLEGRRFLTFSRRLDWHAVPRQAHVAHVYAGLVTLLFGLLWVLSAAVAAAACRRRPDAVAAVRQVLCVAMYLLPLVGSPLYLLRRDDQLFFGGTDGIFTDTVGSLVSAIVHTPGTMPTLTAGTAILTTYFGATVAAMIWGHALRQRPAPVATTFMSIFAMILLEAQLLHWLTGTPFPKDRTALFLLPFVLALPVVLDDATSAFPRCATVVTAVSVCLSALSLWHFCTVVNLQSARDWPHDSSADEAIKRLAVREAAAPSPRERVRVGTDWEYFPAMRYYASSHQAHTPQIDVTVIIEDPLPVDYVYARRTSRNHSQHVVQDYPESDAILSAVTPLP